MKNCVLVYSRLLVLLLVMGSITSTLFSKSVLGFNEPASTSVGTKKAKKDTKQNPDSERQVIVSTQSAAAFVTLPAPNFEAIIPQIQSLFFGNSVIVSPPLLRAQVQSVFQLCVHRNLFFTSIQRSAP